jgi:hypothetical protein
VCGCRWTARGADRTLTQCFYPESAALGPIADRIGLLPTARRLVVRGCEGEGDTTVFLLVGAVAAIVSDKALRAAWADGPRRRKEGLEALPDFIALPRDQSGSGGGRGEAIRNIYYSDRQLPPGHDPGAGSGEAPTAGSVAHGH